MKQYIFHHQLIIYYERFVVTYLFSQWENHTLRLVSDLYGSLSVTTGKYNSHATHTEYLIDITANYMTKTTSYNEDY